MDAQAMTGFYLNEPALLVLRAGAWLGGGALIGAFYFVTLRWNVGMLVIGRAPPLVAALQLARFTVLAGMLAVVAGRFGAAPLLLTAAGMLVARPAVMRLGERM
jgi:F1F0 ATPase subunit 2